MAKLVTYSMFSDKFASCFMKLISFMGIKVKNPEGCYIQSNSLKMMCFLFIFYSDVYILAVITCVEYEQARVQTGRFPIVGFFL